MARPMILSETEWRLDEPLLRPPGRSPASSVHARMGMNVHLGVSLSLALETGSERSGHACTHVQRDAIVHKLMHSDGRI